MSVFYQHIGLHLWQRDCPQTIRHPVHGMCRFGWQDLPASLTVGDTTGAAERIRRLAPDGFQIWGLPAGAERVLRKMKVGDYFLLLESKLFRYAGRVVHRFSDPSHEASRHFWGEGKFPLIVALSGRMIVYTWEDFVRQFAFDPAYHMQGTTARIADQRFEKANVGGEDEYFASLPTDTH